MELPNNVIAIATADLHIDLHAWVDRKEIFGDSMAAFAWIVDLAVENNLPILAAGDLLDKPRNESTPIAFIREQLEALNSGLFFCQGQDTHDRSQRHPWFSSLSGNAIWLADPVGSTGLYTNLPGMNVRGIDWTPAALLPEKLAQLPADVEVLLMHQVCQELMGSIAMPEISVRAIPHARLVIMGDYHKHKVVRTTGASGQDLVLLSPGSTNMRSIDEPSDKFVFLIKDDLTFESLQIPTRIKWSTEIPNEDILNDFVTTVADDMRKVRDVGVRRGVPDYLLKPLVSIRFDPDIPLAYQRIKAAVGDAGHLFTNVLTNTYVVDPIEGSEEERPAEEEAAAEVALAQEISDLGAVACLPLVVNQEEEPEVFELCRRLLDEDDAVAVLTEERRKYLRD